MKRYFKRGTQQVIRIRDVEFPLGCLDNPVLAHVHRAQWQASIDYDAQYRDELRGEAQGIFY